MKPEGVLMQPHVVDLGHKHWGRRLAALEVLSIVFLWNLLIFLEAFWLGKTFFFRLLISKDSSFYGCFAVLTGSTIEYLSHRGWLMIDLYSHGIMRSCLRSAIFPSNTIWCNLCQVDAAGKEVPVAFTMAAFTETLLLLGSDQSNWLSWLRFRLSWLWKWSSL